MGLGVGKLAMRLVRADRTSGKGYRDATGLHGTHLMARAGHCEEVTRSAWLEKVLAMELGWPCSRSHGKKGDVQFAWETAGGVQRGLSARGEVWSSAEEGS